MRRCYYCLLLIILTALSVRAQNSLSKSRQSSFYTYIYPIDDVNLESLYKGNDLDEKTLIAPIDSFLTDSKKTPSLPRGNYLQVDVLKNELRYSLIEKRTAYVKLLNNRSDLQFVVVDVQGKEITDAVVVVEGRRIPWDVKSGVYRTGYPKNGQTLVKVLYADQANFTKISSDKDEAENKRKFLLKKAETGPHYRVQPGLPNSISSGYIVFNKPIYEPGDTVMFKAFILKGKRRKPLREALGVRLFNQNEKKDLGKIEPFQPGSYNFKFFLHDSLKLKLDRSYRIELYRGSEVLQSGIFRFEEYELKSISFNVRGDQEEHSRMRPQILYFKASDENGLNVMDGRVDLAIRSNSVDRFFAERVFVPDTLWRHTLTLDPLGETRLTLPDSIFPPADINYSVEARFLNSNNEDRRASVSFRFVNSQEDDLHFEVKNDSLLIDFADGRKRAANYKISAINASGDTLETQKLRFPAAIKVNPYAEMYEVEGDTLFDWFDMSEVQPGIQVQAKRTADSLFVQVSNPRKIPFWFTVLQGTRIVDRGRAMELDYRRPFGGKQKTTFRYSYIWADEASERSVDVNFADKQLYLDISQPLSLSPGEKAEIAVKVTDAKGKAVQDADLTAYGFTSKFNYSGPLVPYLGKQAAPSRKRPELEGCEGLSTQSVPLDWTRWGASLGLDSIAYFQFTHPVGQYRHREPSLDGLTQIAPFVVEKGKIVPVEVLYINERPVYFSQAQQMQRYAFLVDPGAVKIQFRLKDRLVSVNEPSVAKGEKLVVSYNLDTLLNKSIRVTEAPEKLSDYEASLLSKYMISVSDTYSPRYATISQPDKVFLLESADVSHWNSPKAKLIGPLSYNWVQYQDLAKENDAVNFLAEPGYTYDILPGLIKQKSNADKYPFKTQLNTANPQRYTDTVLTNRAVDSIWSHYLDLRSHTTHLFSNAWPSSRGWGSLRVEIKVSDSKAPVPFIKNIIVYDNNNPDFLNIYPGRETDLGHLDPGSYRLLFLLRGDAYVQIDDLPIKAGGKTLVRIDMEKTLSRDSFSMAVASFIRRQSLAKAREDRPALTLIKETFSSKYSDPGNYPNLMTGYVYSAKEGEPVAGVSVTVKGTRHGVITDVNGKYSINVPEKGKLVFNFIGFISHEIAIKGRGTSSIRLVEDRNALEEVVVVGYGSQKKVSIDDIVSDEGVYNFSGLAPSLASSMMIRGLSTGVNRGPLYVVDGVLMDKPAKDYAAEEIADISVLKDAAATAIYGARGANGVIIITTKKAQQMVQQSGGADLGSDSLSIRKNFSDYAFWLPQLRTGRDGLVRFNVLLPDDITNWRTFFIAMTGKAQSGFSENSIKTFKSVSATLASPRFAVQGDDFQVIGKVMNYTDGIQTVRRQFNYNGKQRLAGNLSVGNAHLDTLTALAEQADSLKFRYTIQKESGYSDGEERSIPVFKAGVLEAFGRFAVLEQDTSLSISSKPELGPVTFRAEASVLPALIDETERLRNYEYLCNEQLASKLKGLLMQKQIRNYLGEPFNHEKLIRQLIKKLDAGRREDGVWGWWKNTSSELWISRHAIEAYIEAEKLGYQVPLRKQETIDYLVHHLSEFRSSDKLEALLLLKKLGGRADYQGTMALYEKEALASGRTPTIHETFKLLLLKQQIGFPVGAESLLPYRHSTMFGNMYFGGGYGGLFDNDIQNTLIAYRILRQEGKRPEWLASVRNYLLEQRQDGYWRNTYESAQILETVLPDLLKSHEPVTAPMLTLTSSGIGEKIKDFPYTSTLEPGEKIEVQKTGDLPVYITAYQQQWDPEPNKVSKGFKVDTWFEEPSGSKVERLTGGRPVVLRIRVDASGDADYAMIEIPVPAGCSYDEKEQNWWGDGEHREYTKNKVNIFCRKLGKGEHLFSVKLMPRYHGEFTLNPAKVEMMYFPVFHGREEIRKVRIGIPREKE